MIDAGEVGTDVARSFGPLLVRFDASGNTLWEDDSLIETYKKAAPDATYPYYSAALTLDEGLGFRADLDEPTLQLLRALDGTSTAHDAVVASLGEEALPRAAELLRGMLETGFLSIA